MSAFRILHANFIKVRNKFLPSVYDEIRKKLEKLKVGISGVTALVGDEETSNKTNREDQQYTYVPGGLSFKIVGTVKSPKFEKKNLRCNFDSSFNSKKCSKVGSVNSLRITKTYIISFLTSRLKDQ